MAKPGKKVKNPKTKTKRLIEGKTEIMIEAKPEVKIEEKPEIKIGRKIKRTTDRKTKLVATELVATELVTELAKDLAIDLATEHTTERFAKRKTEYNAKEIISRSHDESNTFDKSNAINSILIISNGFFKLLPIF